MGCEIGNVKVQRNNINKFVLDSVIELVGNVERRTRKIWITQKLINKRRTKELEEC